MKNIIRQTAGKYVGLAVLALLVVVSFFLGATSERLKAEKLKEAARKNQGRIPDLSYLFSSNAYAMRRESLLGEMQAHSFSSAIQLSAQETNVDKFLSQVRSAETSNFLAQGKFPPSRPFYEARAAIEASRLFPIFRRMPKGGLLHVHESSSGRGDFVITNIARRADCFVWWSTTNGSPAGKGQLKFAKVPPDNDGGLNGYFPFSVLEAHLRTNGIDLTSELHHRYMLDHTDPRDENIWNAFGAWWSLLPELMTYRPVMRDFLRDAFQTMLEDGINHVELRVVTPVGTMFDYTAEGVLNTNYTERDTLQEYLDARDFIRERFKTNFSVQLITTGLRGGNTSDAPTVISRTRQYRGYFTNETIFVGCDFVGDEDTGRTTLDEVPFLRGIASRTNSRIKFYFHDGESDWPDDDNLVDAMLLNTKRVGHGFNLFQFPMLEAMMRTNDIALEICPISNQLLRLLHDLRVHPARGYMNRGVQCVLGSDDPAIFGNYGLSYDFWVAYYAWGLDLDELKQLAANSLRYSALEPNEKTAALARWNKQWDDWVQWVSTQQP